MTAATHKLAELDDVTVQHILGRRDRRLTFLTFAAILGVWTAVTGSGLWEPLIRPMFLPSPVAVAETFWQLLQTGYQGRSLAHHVAVSLYRFATAFLICILVGVPVGLLMGTSRRIRAVVEPPIQAIRPIPKLALLPLFLIWFGIGNLSKIIVIAAPVFPLIAISSMQAVRSVSAKKIQAAQSLGASRFTIFRRILLPASLPGIFTGIRVSISIGVTMLVGAELTATSDGIAWMALTAAEYLMTNVVLVAVLIMALLGYGLDRLFLLIETSIVHWTGKD
ncbi:ABC transporter permease [Tianweitania sediminis]|uniref:ABC transporter permease n=1 Tax=Tianweitania sediminis TaxID=1502156 RepID=A0A8J7R8B1_9HYPH|nr:ABC transporter permease [Tianweitania sediminis]MBP0440052.1 ABC transporter permease [Tianweitania sediminis]